MVTSELPGRPVWDTTSAGVWGSQRSRSSWGEGRRKRKLGTGAGEKFLLGSRKGLGKGTGEALSKELRPEIGTESGPGPGPWAEIGWDEEGGVEWGKAKEGKKMERWDLEVMEHLVDRRELCGSSRPVHHPAGLSCLVSGPTFALLRWWERLDNLYALDRVDRAPFGVRHCRDLTLFDITGASPAEQGKGMSGGVFQ